MSSELGMEQKYKMVKVILMLSFKCLRVSEEGVVNGRQIQIKMQTQIQIQIQLQIQIQIPKQI